MRARYPDHEGFAERDGVRLFYEVYGDGDPTILFMAPSWATHCRAWKAQISYLARHFRVVAYDARGAGRSDRPADTDAYRHEEFPADVIAVMNATGTDRAVTVSASASTPHALSLYLLAPERVLGSCIIGPFFPVRGEPPQWMTEPFNERRESYDGFQRYNRHSMRNDWPGFAEMWFRACYPEPLSTWQIETGVRYALDVSYETAIQSLDAAGIREAGSVAAMMSGAPTDALKWMASQVRCPALVVTGSRDQITPLAWSEALAETLPHAQLEVFDGAGHIPCGRYPVRFNLLLREFVEALAGGTAG